jgi:dephospho-CoA kinase
LETVSEITEHALPALRARLRHVYWIGGGSGAGKSTIARRVAGRHGLRVYATDDAMRDPELLRAETKRLELAAIKIDNTMTEDDLTERVTEAFEL